MVLLALVAWELTESFTLSGVLMASSAIPMIVFTLPGGAIETSPAITEDLARE